MASTFRFVWDGNVLLHETFKKDNSENTELTTWVFEGFVPTAKLVNGKAYSIISDHLGTPILAIDSEGNEVWNRQLDIYGRVKREIKASSLGDDVRPFIPFLYQGQYYDFETKLAYNRYRYYSPEIGAYISQDPIRLNGNNPNLYGYVKDPNISVDIFGLAGTGGAYMFGFANGDKYIGKGEEDRMKNSIGIRSKQVKGKKEDDTIIGKAHISTNGNNELGKMVEYQAMIDAGFTRNEIPSDYLNQILSGETAWNDNPELRDEARELAKELKRLYDADVEARKNEEEKNKKNNCT